VLSGGFLSKVLDLIDKISGELNLPPLVVSEAKSIAERAIHEEIAYGFRPEDVAAVSLYVACRRNKVPLLMREVIVAAKSDRRRALSLYKRVLSSLGVTVALPRPEEHLQYIAAKLKVDSDVVEYAMRILSEANKTGFSLGKNPRVLAAAVLYTASVLANKPVPVKNLANTSKVTSVAIRLLAKRLYELLGFKSA
jgi:transcription initiation factor TFIIIB Brf1 subunit/transcription initiation factor TFIIB